MTTCATKSLFCDNSALEAQLFAPVTTQVIITRDAYNRPTITGGTFAEMFFANGYETGRDRMWSTYFQIRVFSGQLSTMIGLAGLPNDINIKKQDYTDAEYQSQFDQYSNITKTAIQQFVAGFNQRIQDILAGNPDAPMPAQFLALQLSPSPITEMDFIRFGYHITSDFSAQKNGLTATLYYFGQIENLVSNGGYSFADAKQIVSDLYNTRLRRAHGNFAETADTTELPCPVVPKAVRSVVNSAVHETNKEAKSTGKTIADVLADMKKLHDYRVKQGIHTVSQDHLESFSMAISGAHTQKGEPIGMVGPQIDLSGIPGFEFNINMVNDELGFHHNKLGHGFASMGVGGRNGYLFSTAAVLGSLPGTPALLQDSSEDILLRTVQIDVRYGTPYMLDVYGSPHQGFVLEQNITSPLFSGTKSLVARNLDYGKEMSFQDVFFLTFWADSIEQLQDTIRGPGWTTAMDICVIGADNKNHIFGGERAGWYDFGTSDIVPQGVCGEPIPASETIEKRSGFFVVDPAQGYIAEWNSSKIQDLPSIYGEGENSRVQWIEAKIKEIINNENFKSSDIKKLYQHIGNANQGAVTPANNQDYGSDCFHYLFKNRFFQAVGVHPTPDRQAAVNLLADFDGRFVEGDVITDLNISDKWLLAQQWVWEVQKAIIEPTFGNAWVNYAISSDKTQSAGFYYVDNMMSFIARLLQVSSVTNPINYPNWLVNTNSDIDNIIVNALDNALLTLEGLGARPWGDNARPLASYTSSILGPVAFGNSMPAVANRAGIYMAAEFTAANNCKTSSIAQIGQSELIQFVNGIPTLLDDTQMSDYVNWNLKPLDLIKGE
jgi:hypothetical protein